MKKLVPFIFCFILFTQVAKGQSTHAILDRDYYHLIERYEILSGEMSPYFHSHIKPIQRQNIAAFADTIISQEIALNKIDVFNLNYLASDNWEWGKKADNDAKRPIWNTFYRKKSDLYHVDVKDFDLHVNPIIHFNVGKETASDVLTYSNTRGISIRGTIAKRLGFYTWITENQEVLPSYVREYQEQNGVIPGQGFWKSFGDNGYDYFNAKGGISFDFIPEYINFQVGFDKQFIGNGYRSTVVSDFSNNYFYARINTRIWKINYTNLFTQLISDVNAGPTGTTNGDYPVKFLAHHHLSVNIGKNLNIGLFESVVLGDSTGNSFDVAYLNPIIFYRALEHQRGSASNILVGLDWKWNFLSHFSFYGQLTLDEFYLKELTSGEGWWANKFATQLGLKYINAFGIENFAVMGEYNFARPYMYQHFDQYTNYAHYRMPLAHPYGANFTEFVARFVAQPWPKFTVSGTAILSNYGTDEADSINWGKEVMKSYIDRQQDYNNEIGQGLSTNFTYADLTLSYQIMHNMFIDVRGVYRDVVNEQAARNRNTTHLSLGFRWNMARATYDF
jgi:hypothetical protein